MKYLKIVILHILSLLFTSSCTFQWHNEDTGIDHIFGIGYIKVKTPPVDKDQYFILRENNFYGVGINSKPEETNFNLGYTKESTLSGGNAGGAVMITTKEPNNFFSKEETVTA